MLVGLLIAIAGLALSWHVSATSMRRNQLELAKKAFQYGDDHEALALFGRLAKKGNPTAEYWMAHMTELGLGTPRNPLKAIKLYKMAARQNFIKAEVRLGEIYLEGNLVLPNPKQAIKYLDSAAFRGNAHAATLLGKIFRDGIGVPPSSVKADAWFEVATLEGSVIARKDRGMTFRDLSLADQKNVIARVRDILKNIKKRPVASAHGKSTKKSISFSKSLFDRPGVFAVAKVKS